MPRVLAVLLLALTLVAVDSPAQAQREPVGLDRFAPHHRYHGDFADPSIVRVGRHTWYAYATTLSWLNLPMLRSRDLRTWYPVARSHRRWSRDGLPHPPHWARTHRFRGHRAAVTWAPSVRHVGHHFVAVFAARLRRHPDRLCIGVATARRPVGPFVSPRRRPLVCRRDRSVIDPFVYVGPHGARWLYWKTQPRGRATSMIWVRRLNRRGTGFAHHKRHGRHAQVLLRAGRPWENGTVENPAMIRFHHRYYLFYSGSLWATRHYATGYAVCRTAHGPCHRPVRKRLLHTARHIAGPGGASPFVDRRGRLRLLYAAWDHRNIGYDVKSLCIHRAIGCGQRKLHVARLTVRRNGTLRVVRRR